MGMPEERKERPICRSTIINQPLKMGGLLQVEDATAVRDISVQLRRMNPMEANMDYRDYTQRRRGPYLPPITPVSQSPGAVQGSE